jgi:hypothetical protein
MLSDGICPLRKHSIPQDWKYIHHSRDGGVPPIRFESSPGFFLYVGMMIP